MPDATLILFAREVRAKTLRLLEGVTQEQSRFAAPALHNTILWHAGHALMLMEHLGVMPLSAAAAGGGEPRAAYPAGWFDLFSWKSDPRRVPPTSWPTLADVRLHLAEQLDRLLPLLCAADEATLADTDARGRPLRYLILHGLHDEAIHQGEIYLLRKMLAAGSVIDR